mmetsp:Transcript_13567/g.39589  ORF Transcript_13567/g.39589 Transcript_13567/m.39589 type:complete len:96 (+) Transcript_13567:323-610(+)
MALNRLLQNLPDRRAVRWPGGGSLLLFFRRALDSWVLSQPSREGWQSGEEFFKGGATIVARPHEAVCAVLHKQLHRGRIEMVHGLRKWRAAFQVT